MEKKHIDKARIVTKDVNNTVFCTICKELMDDPMECSICNAGFCKECISQNKKCPNNCVDNTIRKAHILVRNLLNSVQVKCENIENGCDKVLAFEYLKKHCSECEFKVITCKYSINGCPIKCLAKDIINHENECGYIIQKCEKGCEQMIFKKDIEKHSCITKLKDMIMEVRERINSASEATKFLACEMAKANYTNMQVGCDRCGEKEFKGVSYRCKVCPDFDLCVPCFKIAKHEHEMKKIFPQAYYIEVLKFKLGEYTTEKNRVDVKVLIKSYESTKQVIRFDCKLSDPVEFLLNDFFEIEPNKEKEVAFTFVLPKDNSKGNYRFWIFSLDSERYFGIPFDILLN